jgi:hypothetical protein
VTIGEPVSAAHVTHTFAVHLTDIVEKGTARQLHRSSPVTIAESGVRRAGSVSYVGNPWSEISVY